MSASKATPPRRFPAALDTLRGARRDDGGADSRSLLRPQRHLHEAALDAARTQVPSGLGLDSAQVRARLVQRLRESGIGCEPVLDAIAAVERHRFVDSALATQAYEDTSLPIGHGQTISKPSVVARMLELAFGGEQARRRGTLGRVLEIGTGCGYQTALLARLARLVVSIERLRPLHERARANLAPQRGGDVRLVYGDGRLGHPPWAPYDTVIAAAGGESLPAAWLEQMALGGRLVAPMHDAASGGQVLCVVDRDEQGHVHRHHEAVHFVPLKSGRE